MKSLLVQLDDATFEALNRIAPARQRRRAEVKRAFGYALAWEKLIAQR